MAAIPFAAEALVRTLPDAVMPDAAAHPVTLKDIIEDFLDQLPTTKDLIENVMLTGASTFVMHCVSSRAVEIFLNSGVTFRS